MFLNCLTLCLFGIVTCFIIRIECREAIRNGYIANIDQFPYQASLIIPGNRPPCGGGIIGKYFVLTAAHCVVKNGEIDIKQWMVLVGTRHLLKNEVQGKMIPVKKIFVRKDFHKNGFGNADIAVLMLKFPLTFSSHVTKLNLPENKHENYTNKLAVIAGFGKDIVEIKDGKVIGTSYSDYLMRFGIVKIVDDCTRGKIQSSPTHLCCKMIQSEPSKPRGACLGDSGGPLVSGNTVIGIQSLGTRDCNEVELGSIFTRVSHYLDFIHHAVNDKHHDNIMTANIS